MNSPTVFVWLVRVLVVCAVSAWAPFARTTVPGGPACMLRSCGYGVDPSLRCAELPANYPLEVDVSCGWQGLDAALPELMLDDGTVLDSEWQPITDGTTAEQYVRVGPELPVGEVVRVMHRVPASCYTVAVQSGCSDGVACLSTSTNDCCTLYEDAGLDFAAQHELRDGALWPHEVDPTGPERPLGPLAYEYTRFHVVEPDRTSPPEVTLRADCRHVGSENSTNYGVDFRVQANDLTDVVELEVFAKNPTTGAVQGVATWRAPRCSGQPARQFAMTAYVSPNPGYSELFVRSHDATGNTSDGPPIEFRYPDDCQGLTLTPPNNDFTSLCTDAPYVVDEQASWCPNDSLGDDEDPSAGATGEGGAGGERASGTPLDDVLECNASILDCSTTTTIAPPPAATTNTPAPSPMLASAPAPAATTPSRESCHCSTPGAPVGPGAFASGFLLACAVLLRRRPKTGALSC